MTTTNVILILIGFILYSISEQLKIIIKKINKD